MLKKILVFSILFFSCLVGNVFSDRDVGTITTYSSSTLVKTGDVKIYSINFVPTANNGQFIIYDATDATGGSGSDLSEIKAEGKEATSGNSQFQDYTNKPLEFSNGLYLSITSGYVILRYE